VNGKEHIMNKSRKMEFGRKVLYLLLLVMTVWFMTGIFSIVSHAQSQGKVTADTAKIRKDASTSSEVLGSAAKNDNVSINGQITGADGNIWYQVYVDASTLGYIRSDLVSITDGSTPSTLSQTTTTTATTTTAATTVGSSSDVTEVNPVSATVTGGQAVRVRSDASTTSSIVTTAESGLAITVNGKAVGSDAKDWYRVAFTVNGSEVTGFIRSDYVILSEDLTEAGAETEPAESQETGETQQDTQTEADNQKYAVALEGENWYLIDNEKAGQYKIDEIFDSIEKNAALYNEAAKSVKSLKAVIIILVIIIIVLGAALTVMGFKVREVSEEAYYAEAERTTSRRKSADRPRTQAKSDQTRQPAGTHRTEASSQNGEKNRQTRQNQPQQSSRQTQAKQSVQSQRRQDAQSGQQRRQDSQSAQNIRQVQNRSDNTVNTETSETRRTQQTNASEQSSQTKQSVQNVGPRQVQTGAKKQPAGRPKNFMADDDEFEFEFLNWDGSDDK
jgi:uncharacterized protein (UPF0333 family)